MFLGITTIKLVGKLNYDGNIFIPRIDLSNGLSCA
jgi:hypothetical protein